MRSMGSRCAGFSSRGSRAPERRLGSCGAQAQLLRGMGDLSGAGIEPAFPALAGRLLSTAPPGKPQHRFLIVWKGDCGKKVPEGEESEERAVERRRPRQPNLREVWGASPKMRECRACC